MRYRYGTFSWKNRSWKISYYSPFHSSHSVKDMNNCNDKTLPLNRVHTVMKYRTSIPKTAEDFIFLKLSRRWARWAVWSPGPECGENQAICWLSGQFPVYCRCCSARRSGLDGMPAGVRIRIRKCLPNSDTTPMIQSILNNLYKNSFFFSRSISNFEVKKINLLGHPIWRGNDVELFDTSFLQHSYVIREILIWWNQPESTLFVSLLSITVPKTGTKYVGDSFKSFMYPVHVAIHFLLIWKYWYLLNRYFKLIVRFTVESVKIHHS